MRKFEGEVEMIMNPPLDSAENIEITNIFQEFVRTANIKNHDCMFLSAQWVQECPWGVRFRGLFDVAKLQNTSQKDPKRNKFRPLTKETSQRN